jgi:hypothetical protein
MHKIQGNRSMTWMGSRWMVAYFDLEDATVGWVESVVSLVRLVVLASIEIATTPDINSSVQ